MPRGKAQQSTNAVWFLFGGVVLVLGLVYATYIIPYMHSKDDPTKEPTESSNAIPNIRANQDTNKVCLRHEEYLKLVERASQPQVPDTSQSPQVQSQSVAERDYRVLADPLYPPMNRTDAGTYQALQDRIQKRDLYVATSVRSTNDSYRLVGYLVNKDAEHDSGGNNWKLMARMKDRNIADFYMIPANRNYDMKIHITDDMVQGTRLRDIYTIPNSISFNTPLLHTSPYEFVEVDKSDLTFTNGGMYM